MRLSIYEDQDNIAYLLLYVNDIIQTASSSDLMRCITTCLSSEFAMTNRGALHHFLGISVTCSSNGLL